MRLFPIIIILIGGVILTLGDIFAKGWVKDNKAIWYAAALFFYIIGLNFLIYSFKFEDIAAASVMLVIFNVATLTIVGWLFFKERISLFEIIGLILGISAIVLLELAELIEKANKIIK